MANTPFPVIEISGSAFERGCQYGETCRGRIADTIAFYKHIFEYESKLDWQASMQKATEFIPFIQSYSREIMTEIEGIAHGAGVPLEEIVAINVRSELLFLLT